MSMRFTMRRGDKMVYLELLIWRDGGTLLQLADADYRLGYLTLL